jgi:hypothetical protein
MEILCEKINVVIMSVLHSCHQLTLRVCTDRQNVSFGVLFSLLHSQHMHTICWVSDSIYTPSDQISVLCRRSSLSMVMQDQNNTSEGKFSLSGDFSTHEK